MATTKTQIVNLALTRIGEDPILTFDDEGKAAALARLHYPVVIAKMLREYTWNHSKKQGTLTPILPAPVFRFANRYPRPADFVRLVALENDRDARWQVYVDGIYTDLGPPVNAEWIEDHGNVTIYDASFVDAVSLECAHRWVTPLAKSVALKTEIRSEFNDSISLARAIDAIEREENELDARTWVDDR